MFDHIVVAFFLAVLFLLIASTLVVIVVYPSTPRDNRSEVSTDVVTMVNNLTTQLAGRERKNVFVSSYIRNNKPCVQVINIRTCDNVVYELSSSNNPIRTENAKLSSAIHRLHVAVRAQLDDNKIGQFVRDVYAGRRTTEEIERG